jgi:hypothetical protein
MKKILAFDSWTGGSHHLTRLTRDLYEFNFSLKLLHLGSWGDDLGRNKCEKIDSLDVVDISYYGKHSLDQILEIESPDIVLFLSSHTFAHRALMRYCKKRNIPTFLLGHGLAGVMVNEKDVISFKKLLDRLIFIFPRMGRFVIHVLPAYMRALWLTGGGIQDWINLARDIGRSFFSSSYLGVAPKDSRASAYAVYTNADIKEYISRYQCKKNDISVVGNPDLLYFGMTDDDFCARFSPRASPKNEIMYIQTGYELEGIFFKNDDDFFSHIIKTNEALLKQAIRLTVKLKQLDRRPQFRDRFLASNIDVIDDINYLPRLKTSVAAIIEPTTAAMVPALMGLPLLLAQYGSLSHATFGKIFLSYPAVQHLTNLADIELKLNDVLNFYNVDSINDWIKENSGPSAGGMPQRVLQAINSLIIPAKRLV